MSFLEVFSLALGLAADAFAVSITAGATGATRGIRSMTRLSFHFGLFQFLMPILGWFAGLKIERIVQSFDHWIAFVLLTWVAIHMMREAKSTRDPAQREDPSKGMLMVTLSVATSLDALAIGFTLALLGVSIWYPAVVIGIITGVVSFTGIALGQRFSGRFGKWAAFAGGVLLFLIGARILISHL